MKHQCPICRKPVVQQPAALAAKREIGMDRGNWASEKYVVSQPLFDEEGEETPEPDKGKSDDDEN